MCPEIFRGPLQNSDISYQYSYQRLGKIVNKYYFDRSYPPSLSFETQLHFCFIIISIYRG